MAKLNVKVPGVDRRLDAKGTRLAGGAGKVAAAQGDEALLRRAVMSCLLWEDVAYQSGSEIAKQITSLIPQVDAGKVADIAIEARTVQKLRHVPLLIARVMAKLPTHKHLVGALLPEIIRGPDELTEFLAIYRKDGGKEPLSKQVKIGLGAALKRFNEYQLGKYNREGAYQLRDVLFLTHPKADTAEQEGLWAKLANQTLATPDTWEVALSTGKDKKATWERLISEGKLGALALVRNLRNMEQAKVSPAIIRKALATVNAEWLLPLNMLTAAKHAPAYERELEALMLRCLASTTKLPDHSILVIDVSGSMNTRISSKSEMTRLDAASAMAMLASEVCESVTIYVTAGSDTSRKHATEVIKPRRGFALAQDIASARTRVGGGGIFTRQMLEYLRTQEREDPARIMVFSDSQDCDTFDKRPPQPFGKANYIIDVGAHTHGVNYAGSWTAEVAGWSEHFLSYIAALEGVGIPMEGDDSLQG